MEQDGNIEKIFKKMELTLNKYEEQLYSLLDKMKECEDEQIKILGEWNNESR